MPRLAKISITGLYATDETIFDDLEVPEAIDKDFLVANILVSASEFEILYPDAAFMRKMISIWSRTNRDSFIKVAEALGGNYNPIHNYDRTEIWDDSQTADGSTKIAGFNVGELQEAQQGKTTANAKRNGHIYGNVGVTTTQQMIREEMELRKQTIYDYITNLFIRDFCIMIY